MGTGKARAPRRYVALMRGINVGGKNKLPMKDLARFFEEARCAEVRTYIQSGNVLFSASEPLARRVPALIAEAVAGSFGYSVPVVVRSVAELELLAEANPFAERMAEGKHMHLMCLADTPSQAAVEALDFERFAPDLFALRGANVYVYLPNGSARSKLNTAYFDRALDTTSTMRNWNTVRKLVELGRASG